MARLCLGLLAGACSDERAHPEAAGGATPVVRPEAGAGGQPGGNAPDGGTGAGPEAGVVAPFCGDGVKHAALGERCDDGPAGSHECTPDCRASFEILFDPLALPSFYLEIPEASARTLSSCTLEASNDKAPPPECDYQLGSFYAVYDPHPNDGVEESITTEAHPIGIRRKGRATWRDLNDKPSWKLKFTEFGGAQFLGLTRLTLNNMIQDPSGLRERIGYELFRAAGVLAPLANSARVFVKIGSATAHTYAGLYANVQTVDKQFAEFHFGEVNGKVGNLYDTYNDRYFTDLDRSALREQAGTAPGAQEARYQLETNETPGDVSGLTALIDAVYVPTVGERRGTFWSEVTARLDGGEFLAAFGMMALLSDWDGFAGARNNYKLYHEIRSDRFMLIPWGIDQTFGQSDGPPTYRPNWAYALDHGTSDRDRALLLLRCLNDSEGCGARYKEAVGRASDVFQAFRVAERVATLHDQIAVHVDWNSAYFEQFIAYLKHYANERTACVNELLTGAGCRRLTCPMPGPGCVP